MKMDGKTVLITGSTDGVGRYVATKLAATGAKVLIHGRDKTPIEGLHVQVGDYHEWFDLGDVEPMVDVGLGKLKDAPASGDDGSDN